MENKEMKSLRFLIVLLLMPLSFATHAFKVGQFEKFNVVIYGDSVHEDITIAALNQTQVTIPNGFKINFSVEAATAIETANRNTDSEYWDDPIFHFDEEKFEESTQLLKQNRTTIIENISSKSSSPDEQKARMLLGQSLHTIQDFFAHSSWVDQKIKSNPLLPTPRPWDENDAQLKKKDSSAATCTHDDWIPGAPLTTGWYDLGMATGLDLGWMTDDWAAQRKVEYINALALAPTIGMVAATKAAQPFLAIWPANKCVHGGDKGAGLNKDHDDRPGFSDAKKYAIEASTLFVNEIIEELKAQNDYKAICRLMDQEDNANCKYVENLGAASVSSTASTITTIDKIVLWIKDALSYIKKVRWEIFNTWGEQVDHFESTNSDPTKSFPMERMLPDSGSYTARATFFDSESITIGQSSVTFDVERSIAAFPKITITDTLDASSGNPAPIIDSITTTRFPIVTGSLSKSLDQRIGHKQTINLYDNDKLVENYVSYNDKVEWSWKPNKPLSLGVHSFRASISEMGVEGEKTAPWIVEIKDDLSKIEIPATSFVRGESVALSANGYGADTLMNAPPYGPAENAAEWDINVPSSGRYELFAIYASGESRPVSISFNGITVFGNALSAATGGYFPVSRQTISQGVVELNAGKNTMRIFEAGTNVFPHIQGFHLVAAPLAHAGDLEIDLGSEGKLIAPVQVEGNWYYYWDRSGDGTLANKGTLNNGSDLISQLTLRSLITKDKDGNPNPTSSITEEYRFGTINGVDLAIPTIGYQVIQEANPFYNGNAGTSVSNGSTNNEQYDDLLAIWDAYNGNGTSYNIAGINFPALWPNMDPTNGKAIWSSQKTSDFYSSHYVLARDGYVRNREDNYLLYAIVQVLSKGADTTPPSISIRDNVAGTASGPITFTFTFSEPVTGFDETDITISDGAKGKLTESGANYSIIITPPAGRGTFTLDIAEGAVKDLAGLASTKVMQVNQAYTDRPIIELGEFGRLVNPVQADGNWYYFWSRNSTFNHTYRTELNSIFNKDISGNLNPSTEMTNTYRYGVINGIRLAMPESSAINAGIQTPTKVNNGASTNILHKGLLAIWDANNGTGTKNYCSGNPFSGVLINSIGEIVSIDGYVALGTGVVSFYKAEKGPVVLQLVQ